MTYLSQLEALLFVAGEEGLSLRQLASLLELTPTALQQQLDKLSQKYEKDKESGLCLIESSRTYKLVTKECLAPLLRDYAKAPIKDRKSTRLNSSHANISYAVFCLKKKNKI